MDMSFCFLLLLASTSVNPTSPPTSVNTTSPPTTAPTSATSTSFNPTSPPTSVNTTSPPTTAPTFASVNHYTWYGVIPIAGVVVLLGLSVLYYTRGRYLNLMETPTSQPELSGQVDHQEQEVNDDQNNEEG